MPAWTLQVERSERHTSEPHGSHSDVAERGRTRQRPFINSGSTTGAERTAIGFKPHNHKPSPRRTLCTVRRVRRRERAYPALNNWFLARLIFLGKSDLELLRIRMGLVCRSLARPARDRTHLPSTAPCQTRRAGNGERPRGPVLAVRQSKVIWSLNREILTCTYLHLIWPYRFLAALTLLSSCHALVRLQPFRRASGELSCVYYWQALGSVGCCNSEICNSEGPDRLLKNGLPLHPIVHYPGTADQAGGKEEEAAH